MNHNTTSSFRGVWSIEQGGQTVEEDISTATKISTKPLLEDVHDAKTVYVAESSIPGAAEGVFLRRDLGKGSLAAIYNGVRMVKQFFLYFNTPGTEKNNMTIYYV